MLAPVIEQLVAATDPDAIILFGSRARGSHREDSDYDLFVLVPEMRPFGGRPAFWLWTLVQDLGLPVDVLIRQSALFERRSKAIGSLEHAVSKDGIALYKRGEHP